MKRFLLYLSVCCWTLLAACTEEPLGRDDDGDVRPPTPEVNDSTHIDVSDQTNDGQPPYVRLEENELRLSSKPSRIQFFSYQTNLENLPVVEVLPEEDAECFVKLTNMDNWSVEFEASVNYTDQERVNYIRFKTHRDSLLATVKVVQDRGAVYELVEEKATINSLQYRYTTNGAVQYVFYGLSRKKLYGEGEVVKFLEGYSVDKDDRVGQFPLAEGTHDFTLSFDGLSPSTTYYLYVLGAPNKDVSYGNYQEKVVSTAAFESKHDLVMTVSANPANQFTVILPFGNVVQGTINWGDGSSEQIASGLEMIKHRYRVSKATNYTVRFSGIVESLSPEAYAPLSHMQNTLVAITQWGVTGLKHIDLGGFTSLSSVAPDTEGGFASVEHFGVDPYGGSFSDTNIERIPADFFKYAVRATSFDNTFSGCKKLKSIPKDLFKYTTNATSFSYTFAQCGQLQSIPSGLFDHTVQATNFRFAFAGCEQVKQLPAGLFAHTPQARNFRGTFKGCKALQTVPADLFANCKYASWFGQDRWTDIEGGYRGGGGVFEGCSSLQTLPENLFAACASAEDMSYAFKGCTALKAIPAGVFRHNNNLARIQGIFEGCTGLQSIPHALFDHNRGLTNVQSAFEECRNVTGESPYTTIEVNGKPVKAHLYERRLYPSEFTKLQYYASCFFGCKNLTDYNQMVWDDSVR